MTHTLHLPVSGGRTTLHTLGAPGAFTPPPTAPRSRVAYAAAHVVADPYGDNTPGAPAVLDWDRTLALSAPDLAAARMRTFLQINGVPA
ncbi:DUF993 family protein [Streptomyces asiaticus]